MSRPDEDLLARYLEGELAPGEEAALLDLLRRDPKAAEQLESFLRLDEGLREALVPEASGPALVRAVAERLAKHGGTGVFKRQVVEQIAAAEKSGRKKTRWIRILRPRDRSSGAWTFPLVAAAALFAILLLAAVASQPRGRPSRPGSPEARVEPPPPPEPDPAPSSPERPPRAAPERGKPVPERKSERIAREDAGTAPRELPEPRTEEPRIPTPEVPRPPAPPPTVPAPAAVAQLDRVEGDVVLVAEGHRNAAKSGQGLLPGQGLDTAVVSSSASIVYPDGTRVELGSDTRVQERGGSRGKRFDVDFGTVTAVVNKQPAGQPMTFETPHARAEVLGTILRLTVNKASTRLEVKEGRVRLVPRDGSGPVEVGADQLATASAGVKPSVRPMAIDEILLLPQEVVTLSPDLAGERILRQGAVLVGADWQYHRDPRVFEAGQVWNGLDTPVRQRSKKLMRSYVEFKFAADEDKEYTIWVRGCRGKKGDGEGSGTEWYRFDFLAVEPVDALCSSGHKAAFEGRAYEFNGYGQREGFWWISGNADPGTPSMTGEAANNPVKIKFLKRGTQVLRVYPIETPMSFNAVWLSASQQQRPQDDQTKPQKK